MVMSMPRSAGGDFDDLGRRPPTLDVLLADLADQPPTPLVSSNAPDLHRMVVGQHAMAEQQRAAAAPPPPTAMEEPGPEPGGDVIPRPMDQRTWAKTYYPELAAKQNIPRWQAEELDKAYARYLHFAGQDADAIYKNAMLQRSGGRGGSGNVADVVANLAATGKWKQIPKPMQDVMMKMVEAKYPRVGGTASGPGAKGLSAADPKTLEAYIVGKVMRGEPLDAKDPAVKLFREVKGLDRGDPEKELKRRAIDLLEKRGEDELSILDKLRGGSRRNDDNGIIPKAQVGKMLQEADNRLARLSEQGPSGWFELWENWRPLLPYFDRETRGVLLKNLEKTAPEPEEIQQAFKAGKLGALTGWTGRPTRAPIEAKGRIWKAVLDVRAAREALEREQRNGETARSRALEADDEDEDLDMADDEDDE